MRSMAVALALLVAGSGLFESRASTLASVWGRLSVTEGRGPVARAVVRLECTTQRFSTEVATDAKGRFARIGLPPGNYTATVSREGFAPVEIVDITVRPGRRLRLDVELTPLDEAPFARERRQYRRPLLNTESATVEYTTP
jgi:hypothetical protein